MIRSIFRQIWNQHRANIWVWSELTVVAVLLWYGVDFIYNYEAAAVQPKGYDTDNVFDITFNSEPKLESDSVMNSHSQEYLDQMYSLIHQYEGVEEACYYYGSVPYTGNLQSEGYAPHTDSTHLVSCYIRYVSPTYFKVFRLEALEGAFNADLWKAAEYPMPVLMSLSLSDSLFSGKTAVGQTCFNPYFLNSQNPQTNYKVMAVLPAHKTDDYQRYEPFIYLPAPPFLYKMFHVAVRVNESQAVGFAERFTRDMQKKLAIGPYHLYDISSYADMKESFDIQEGTVNYLNTAYAVIAFFIFNIFLGMLATFWFRTRKRRGEIALRLAMGSTRWNIFGYYVMEGLLLLAFAAVPAVIICLNIQVADLTVHTLMDPTIGRFVICMLLTLLILALIIIIGICFPARQAMRIEPAEALHNE